MKNLKKKIILFVILAVLVASFILFSFANPLNNFNNKSIIFTFLAFSRKRELPHLNL